jgi:hypothetical protein
MAGHDEWSESASPVMTSGAFRGRFVAPQNNGGSEFPESC